MVQYGMLADLLYFTRPVTAFIQFISCVFLVLAAILCVVDLVASSQSRVSLGYAWNDDPGGSK